MLREMLLSGLCIAGIPQLAGGIPVFHDDFSVKEKFVDTWHHKRDVSIVNGEALIGTGEMSMISAPPENFRLSFTMTIKKDRPERRGQKFGFGVFRFGKSGVLLRTDLLLVGPGGNIAVPSKTCNITVDFQKQEKGELVIMRCKEVPGRSTQASFPARSEKDRITFGTYGCDIAIDNVSIEQLNTGDTSPNVIINSSFEYLQDGMPTYFNTQTPRIYTFKKPYEDFLNQIGIDSSEKRSGKNSFRITFQEGVSLQEGIYSTRTGVVKGHPATFSVYMKADRENLPVKLTVWEYYSKWHNKTVNLTKEWKRYQLDVPSTKEAGVACGVTLETPGTVWIDDLQLELSKESTPYKASSLDQIKFFPQAPQAKTEPLSVKLLSSSPLKNGNIDSWIKHAAPMTSFYGGRDKIADRTKAWAACDADYLYIAVRAYIDDISKVKKENTPHDSFNIFNQENIDLMLDPGKTQTDFYQFTAGASGSQTEIGKGNISWNCNWKNNAKYNPSTKSIDYEIAIPLSSLCSAETLGTWGFNIGRHDSSRGQHSCIYPQNTASFQNVKTFPKLIIPTDILKKFAIGVSDPNIAKNMLVCKISDFSGKERKCGLSVIENGKTIASRDNILIKDNMTITFPLEKLPSENILTFLFTDEKKAELSKQSLFVKKQLPVVLTTRFSRYSLSDPAANFRIQTFLQNPENLHAELVSGSVKVEKKASSSFEMDFPLQNIPAGTHNVTLNLKNKEGKILASATVPMIKMDLPKGAARINNYTKCLNVDGKNTFFFMPMLSTRPGNPERFKLMADWLAKHGFKQCIFVIVKKHGLEKAEAFLEQASKNGISVIAWFIGWDSKTPDQEILADVKRMNKYNCVAAWKVLDEPELHMKSEDAKLWMKRMMKLIPEYPVFMNNITGGIVSGYAGYETDILMLDDYLTNSEGKTVIGNVMPPMDLIVTASSKSRNQPPWFWLSGNNSHNHYREPSMAEQTAQTWGCVAAGATGLAYFDGMPYWPGNWKAYQQLNKELIAMNDIILSEEICSPVKTFNPNIRFMTRKYKGDLYIFAVNVDTKANNLHVVLPTDISYSGKVEKVFDHKTFSLSGNQFSEELPPYSRHIYKIRIIE